MFNKSNKCFFLQTKVFLTDKFIQSSDKCGESNFGFKHCLYVDVRKRRERIDIQQKTS